MKIDKPKSQSITAKKAKYDRYRREHRREKHKMIHLKALIKNLSPENRMRILMEKRIEDLHKIVRGY